MVYYCKGKVYGIDKVEKKWVILFLIAAFVAGYDESRGGAKKQEMEHRHH
jgi:hypothetical protein